jgi:putative N6-adenine-specific DNA methylase
MPPSSPLSLFAVSAPGLEPIVASELGALGLRPGEPEPGGVAFAGATADVWRANLWLRTAGRVVVRLAEFRATAFYELERHARRIPWEQFVAPGRPVRFRVTCRKSRLYHSDAVAERFVAAVAHRLGGESPALVGGSTAEGGEGDEEGEEGAEEAQLFIVRLLHDQCTVSVDSSGALLHRRGYRQAVAKAPLRETLAAAMLMASGWRGDAPLLDPMCGSGTLAIEGALLARGRAPGVGRSFAFMRWPGFDEGAWSELVERARQGVRTGSIAPIQASDRDAGATAAALANAARAGVAGDIEITTRALSAIEPPPGAGWVVTNPPYGVRVGEADRVRNLYAQLGKVVRAECPGWTLALLTADRAMERQVGVPLHEALRTVNGGIPVRLAVGKVP